MKADNTTIRLLDRVTDRLNAIRKHPRRYEMTDEDHALLRETAQKLEAILARVRVVTS
jgi:hypothetical protein